MYRFAFNQVKKIIPKISETEIIALKSGGVSIDREIFQGKVDYKKLYKRPNVVKESNTWRETDELLARVGQANVYPSDNIHSLMKFLGQRGYLGMIIDKKYGGNRLSVSEQSRILTKISSYNPSLGVVTMVPNSLGPAELIQHYGTDSQKAYYLPKLADGTFIPCFGLTGPNNGSDAIGSIDKGAVVNVNGKIKIKVSLNKRYITLAPVSNLVGIAFNLEDPSGLLVNHRKGITLALVEKGLEQTTYHNPNNAGFPNGTVRGEVYLDVDQVIGGEEKIGEGWKMLMECLAVGRGVSLPAAAAGSSKFATHAIMNYINIRRQFNMPIGNMEAVREKFVEMYLNTWIIHTSVAFTNHILDGGATPSVISAIMKQQTTERGRVVLNHGMDIYAGSGICVGENNFFTKFYNSSPIGITVEGSNTLTRGLIIFGQGLNKSHPYIFPIFQSIQNDDLAGFRKHFNDMVVNCVGNYMRLMNPFSRMSRLERVTVKFSLLSNFVAIMGGKIKSKQMISGNMADALSSVYLSYGLMWYHLHNASLPISLRERCLEYLLNDSERKMNLVIANYPVNMLSVFLRPLKTKINYIDFERTNEIYKTILESSELHDTFRKDIYYKGTVIEKMEKLRTMERNSAEYEALYQDIISVGEIKNVCGEIKNETT
jgi:acyl-CoA dehydrogenase